MRDIRLIEETEMIYALNTPDASEQERRAIARQIRDNRRDLLSQSEKVVLVSKAEDGYNKHWCIYCMYSVHKFESKERIHYHHSKDRGCIGSDKGLPGIENPRGVVIKLDIP